MKVKDMPVSDTRAVSEAVERILKEHGITHVTLQFECGRCRDAGVFGKHP